MGRFYRQLDHALEQWKETLKEVERVGKAFWEVREFQRLPGVGPIAWQKCHRLRVRRSYTLFP